MFLFSSHSVLLGALQGRTLFLTGESTFSGSSLLSLTHLEDWFAVDFLLLPRSRMEVEAVFP